MSYILKNIYTKTNAETEINFWDGTPIVSLIDTYFDAGKITQKPAKVVDGLTETYTTIFKDRASYDEFASESTEQREANNNKRESYCSDNSISWSIERP